jgi:phage gpG-like protein
VAIADTVRELRGVAQRTGDMTPILRVVAADIRTKIDDSFEQLKTPSGDMWPDLSEATLMERAKRARGFTTNRTIGPLREGERRRTARRWTARLRERVDDVIFNARALNDTGRLRRSITTQVGPRSLSFGTNVVYAAKQNFGDDSNMFGGHAAPVPARRYLPTSEDGTRLEPESFWQPQFDRIEHWLATGEVT